jgi:hypothetical protein
MMLVFCYSSQTEIIYPGLYMAPTFLLAYFPVSLVYLLAAQVGVATYRCLESVSAFMILHDSAKVLKPAD